MLLVLINPTNNRFKSVPKNETFREGETAILDCSARDNHPFFWTKPGQFSCGYCKLTNVKSLNFSICIKHFMIILLKSINLVIFSSVSSTHLYQEALYPGRARQWIMVTCWYPSSGLKTRAATGVIWTTQVGLYSLRPAFPSSVCSCFLYWFSDVFPFLKYKISLF